MIAPLIRFDGDPSVGIGVVRQSKANLIDVSNAIHKALPEIAAELPPGVHLTTAFDQSVFVKRSIADAERTLVEAALLVVVIIFLFLRNFRATLIPAFAIPTSIISTFAVMFVMGYSINNFTLLALTIAIGIVVDDAIIVLENCLSASGGTRRGSDDRRAAGHQRDRLRGHCDDRFADGGVRAAGVPARQHRPALQ